jgi:hypothetical protein
MVDTSAVVPKTLDELVELIDTWTQAVVAAAKVALRPAGIATFTWYRPATEPATNPAYWTVPGADLVKSVGA